MRMFKPSVSAVERPSVELIESLCPTIALQRSAMTDCELLSSISGKMGKELAWVGKVTLLPTGNVSVYHVTEVALVKQVVSSASTVLDAIALAQLADKWMEVENGYNPLKFLAHSHPGFSTDPSPRDQETMRSFIRGPATPPFLVRAIFTTCATDALVDFTVLDYQRGIMFCHVPWRVVDDDRRSALEQLVMELVSDQAIGTPVAAPIAISRGVWGQPSPAHVNRAPLVNVRLKQGGPGDDHDDDC